MVLFMLEIGKIIWDLGMDYMSINKKMNIQEIILMIKNMAKEYNFY